MFTIKLYTYNSPDGEKITIREAESFTVLRDTYTGEAEITLHQRDGSGQRVDIGHASTPRPEGFPPVFQKAIIENSSGKTTEIIGLRGPMPNSDTKPPPKAGTSPTLVGSTAIGTTGLVWPQTQNN